MLAYPARAISFGTVTGTASWGIAGGSSLRMPSMQRSIGRV